MQQKFVRQGKVVLNTNTEELDKYYEQRRAIQNRNAQKEEQQTLTQLVEQLVRDVAEIKQLLLDKKD